MQEQELFEGGKTTLAPAARDDKLRQGARIDKGSLTDHRFARDKRTASCMQSIPTPGAELSP